jgi:predicted RNA-binding Zn-ribbon protein involved in translation (DUF1610 family)
MVESSESVTMKDHIDVRCPACGGTTPLPWPTSHKRGAEARCHVCGAQFPMAVAVEQAIIGDVPRRDRRGPPAKPDGRE